MNSGWPRLSACWRSPPPKTPLIFQPLFQGTVALTIGVAILANASTRLKGRGESFRAIAAQLPVE
jgi:hypothetical protein